MDNTTALLPGSFPPTTSDINDFDPRQNTVGTVILHGVPIVSLFIDGKERLCLAQISNSLLKNYSYNEIHNRRVALGITCVQCTPVQLEILRRAGAMPISSRRCGMITKREAERLVTSFLEEISPPKLPDNFAFNVYHECGWGCKGQFVPSRYNSSRAKCIRCSFCDLFFSPNKFIFHFHRTPNAKYQHPDAANFNSWRRHLHLDYTEPHEELVHAWEDVKAMFNGGSRKRIITPSKSPPKQEEENYKRPKMMTPNPSLPTRLPVLPFNNPPYVPRSPHPAFPFFPFSPPVPDVPVQNKANALEFWNKKAPPPYINPLGYLWARNLSFGQSERFDFSKMGQTAEKEANQNCKDERSTPSTPRDDVPWEADSPDDINVTDVDASTPLDAKMETTEQVIYLINNKSIDSNRKLISNYIYTAIRSNLLKKRN
ncbi:DgyrCDS5643 [Dimorphilus gyrociliatus]|uniref:DgyrCDS5643 n=1 Tax=Dimorphilus gyrociliatus TaxID=2664684 RepID=A0A7I8VL52_9ANNE|nr:DgyrCDS5643 [Dimorphilus gyrociliatus]